MPDTNKPDTRILTADEVVEIEVSVTGDAAPVAYIAAPVAAALCQTVRAAWQDLADNHRILSGAIREAESNRDNAVQLVESLRQRLTVKSDLLDKAMAQALELDTQNADLRAQLAQVKQERDLAYADGYSNGIRHGKQSRALVAATPPMCAVHAEPDRKDTLVLEVGNDCIACSLHERTALLSLLEPFAADDGSEDSLTVLRNVIASAAVAATVNDEGEQKWRVALRMFETSQATLSEVAQCAQAVLTALNVGDIQSGSLLHLKLREVMIAYRQRVATATSPTDNEEAK